MSSQRKNEILKQTFPIRITYKIKNDKNTCWKFEILSYNKKNIKIYNLTKIYIVRNVYPKYYQLIK